MTNAEIQGTIATYTYDGSGLRQSKTVNGVTTNHIWDGANLTVDIENGSVIKYQRGATGLISRNFSSTTETYFTNGHGDVVKMYSGSTLVQNYEFDAFGNEKTGAVDNNPFRYAGEYLDSETGFIYLRAR